jgi:hypothetical protein
MSANLETILAEFEELSTAELLTLQERITQKLRQRIETNDQVISPDKNNIFAPQPTPEEIEAELIEIFGEQEYSQIKAAIADGILDRLPTLPKPLSHYVIEDREDRV